MKIICFDNLLRVIISLVPLVVTAQEEIRFTNKATYTKIGDMNITKFVSLLPAPVTNEYQEITDLKATKGSFIVLNEANKVLYYEGAFGNDSVFETCETFRYKTKKIKIDFSNKSDRNIVTGINPESYLLSDGYYIDTANAVIKYIGTRLWNESSNILEYAERCYQYVATHCEYINGDGRPLAEIFRIGGGVCCDFTTLFVNLMVYKGIPARHNWGVLVNGEYHVWPDFYHEDYGWIPVDPTFKHAHPEEDYFGRYDGGMIIMSQGLTTFIKSDVHASDIALQKCFCWYWYNSGSGTINARHEGSKIMN